jgi:poly(3-hydroxybutyrate) depolymerase
MSRALATLLVLCAAATAAAASPEKVVKETFGAGGRNRTYYLFVPDGATAAAPAPLLLLLHGSGRDGRSLLDPWLPFAKERGIILVAPESNNRQVWSMRDDGPDFLYSLVEMIRVQHPVDPRRLYVFGHSAGALHALAMAVLESQYFAAVAAHAGTLPDQVLPFVAQAPRKTPVAIWVGTNDPLFPVHAVRATQTTLNKEGFSAAVTEIPDHTHNYYNRASDINRQAWEFLEKHRLDEDPQYRRYETR